MRLSVVVGFPILRISLTRDLHRLSDNRATLTLSFNLMVLKAYLAVEPLQLEEALEGLDRAIEAIYPYTQFHRVSYKLFRNVVEGKMTIEQEELLKKLGIKF